MRRLLSDRNFRLLAAGQTLSTVGDYAMFLALGVWAKDLTGSNAAAGLTFLPFSIPSLFAPLLGVFVDRYPRRQVMILTDLVAAVAMCSLFLVDGPDDVWILYLVSFLNGTCLAVYEAARSGLLVAMVDEELLGDANGLIQSAFQATRLIAPLLGAGLFAVAGGRAVAGFDAATFVISAGFLMAVRAQRDIERRSEQLSFWPELRAGLRHIWGTEDLRRLTLGTAGVTMLIGVTEVAIFAVVDQGLHKPPEFLGLITSMQGVGAILAGILAGRILRRFGEMAAIAAASVAAGLGLALFGVAILPLAFVAAFSFGIANTLFMVGYMTVMQRRTSLAMQGRVMSAVEAAITVPFLVSMGVGAMIITAVDFRIVYGTVAVGLLVIAAYFWRGVPRREAESVAADSEAA